MSATSRAWASTSPTSSAFCSPVEAQRRRRALGAVEDDEVADVRADQRAARRRVAAAAVAEQRAVAILGDQRRVLGGERLDFAFERQRRPGKRRILVAVARDRRGEPVDAFAPRRGDGDAELRRLALQRVEPMRCCARPLRAGGCGRARRARRRRRARRGWGRSPAPAGRGTGAARSPDRRTARPWSASARRGGGDRRRRAPRRPARGRCG